VKLRWQSRKHTEPANDCSGDSAAHPAFDYRTYTAEGDQGRFYTIQPVLSDCPPGVSAWVVDCRGRHSWDSFRWTSRHDACAHPDPDQVVAEYLRDVQKAAQAYEDSRR